MITLGEEVGMFWVISWFNVWLLMQVYAHSPANYYQAVANGYTFYSCKAIEGGQIVDAVGCEEVIPTPVLDPATGEIH